MKLLARTIGSAWLLVAGVAVLGAQTAAEAEKLLEAARHREVMEGDLKAAVEQYRKIAAQFAKQPEIAARALFEMGQCQEKLGQAEARRSYERVVREYGSAQYAAAARTRLASMGGVEPGGQAMHAVWPGQKAPGGNTAVSPDGRFIVFQDFHAGNTELHDLVTGADRILIKRGESGHAYAFTFSRDGRQLAYAWIDPKNSRNELWALDLAGDPTPRRLGEAPGVWPRDWSPDGKWIAADLWDQPRAAAVQIVLIGAQDGALHSLKSGGALSCGGFSADGRYLVYTTGGYHSQAYILAVDGKSEVPLMSGPASIESAIWSPDGSRIVFVSDISGSPGLWSIRVSEGKPVGEAESLKAGFDSAKLMRFTRDGSLFYDLPINASDVYVAGLDPATGRLTSEPKRVNQRIGRAGGPVAWLPDGKSLSFWNGGPLDGLVAHALANGEEREIWGGRSGRAVHGYSGWFSDGSILSRLDRGQNLVFRREDSSTGAVQASWTVPALPTGRDSWVASPGLMTLYFVRKDEATPCEGKQCTFVMTARGLETGKDSELFRIKARSAEGISVSPDGQKMAFIAIDERGKYSLMTAPTGGGTPRKIYETSGEAGFSHTVWTADGGHVLAQRITHQGISSGGKVLDPPGGEVLSFPVNGGSPEKSIVRIRPADRPAVSPDGTQIALVGYSYSSEIWIMTGLFPDAKPAPRR